MLGFLRKAMVVAGVVVVAGWIPGAPLAAQDQALDPGQADPGEAEVPLTVSGFGIINSTYDAKTNDNTFAASKIALGLFREINDNAYLFGQLTTALGEDETTGEVVTETEIDNLLLSLTIPGAPDLSFNFGKLDLPVGFERDDEPLLFLATPSFNFELARPAKMVGLTATWSASARLQVTGLLFNGWDSDIDPNHGKTGGLRLDVLPCNRVSLGFSGLYGNEGDQGATNQRMLLTFDYAYQPSWNWVFAGEANYGKDMDVAGVGDQEWKGGMLTVVHFLDRHFGVTARAEVLDDPDGARTGQPQRLESYSIAPLYSLGVGREGIFANVTHTTVRIPRFQLRSELRLNHSTDPFFQTDNGLSRWGVQVTLQAVTTF